MAVSLSGMRQAQMKKTIADQLAGQTEDLQETPWWKTVGSVALPLLATAAMGPLGGYLSTLGGSGSILGALGGALGSTTAATGGTALANLGTTLAHTTAKAGYNALMGELGDKILDAGDRRSEKDIKVSGGPMAQFLGKGAQDKLRKQYRDAQSAEGGTRLTGAVLGAMGQQFGGDALGELKKMFGGEKLDAAGNVIPEVLQGTPDLVQDDTINILDKVAQINKGNPPNTITTAPIPAGSGTTAGLPSLPGVPISTAPLTTPGPGVSPSQLPFGGNLQGIDDQTILELLLALQNK